MTPQSPSDGRERTSDDDLVAEFERDVARCSRLGEQLMMRMVHSHFSTAKLPAAAVWPPLIERRSLDLSARWTLEWLHDPQPPPEKESSKNADDD